MNPPPSAQTILSGLALLILGILGLLLTFHAVPQENRELLSTIEGAIAGALMMGGSGKLADKITNSKSDTATIQPDGGPQ